MEARLGEGACGIESQLWRQLFGIALENAKCVFEGAESGVASDFADGAENRDRAELFENVGVTQEDAFERSWIAGWKVGSDDLDNGWNFLGGKAESLKQGGCFFERVSDVIPFCERDWVFGTMADEDAEVVQPGGGVEDVVVERLALRNLFCEFVEARLMGEFVGWPGVGADVIGDGAAVFVVGHGQKIR